MNSTGEHLHVRRHPRQRRVPARAVDDGSDCGGVKVTVLLGKILPEREFDLDLATAHGREFRPQRLHQPLTSEARTNAILNVRFAPLARFRTVSRRHT
jgi:hypothetical protein